MIYSAALRMTVFSGSPLGHSFWSDSQECRKSRSSSARNHVPQMTMIGSLKNESQNVAEEESRWYGK